MKNLNGTTEDLTLYHQNGKVAYKFENYDGFNSKRTYDEKGNQITFENSDGFNSKRTYDEKSNELTYEDSNGFNSKYTYDEKGNMLTYEDSNGYYKIKGKKVTKEEFEAFQNRTKEYTMEELVFILGHNFKIKK